MAKYEGFSNEETWTVAFFIMNDENSLNYWRRRHKELSFSVDRLAEEMADRSVEVLLDGRRLHRNDKYHLGISDLLQHAIGAVNWQEIAEHITAE